MSDILKQIGVDLKKAMEAKNISIMQLSKLSGEHYEEIAAILTGQGDPFVKDLAKLFAVLDKQIEIKVKNV